MGCDFYILKLLHIYYSENEYLEIEINREKGYYNDLQFDEDADDFDELIHKHMEEMLIVEFDPIIIYSNNKFHKSYCECKYKTLIESELNKCDKSWSQVTKILKVEERRER
jgi:hypothetical protein